MNLPQENFDAAQTSARGTIRELQTPVTLRRKTNRELSSMLWDLEAMGAALRLELMNRSDQPVDLG